MSARPLSPQTGGLALAADLSLPVDAATQTFALLGRRGSGKSYAAGKLTELLLGAGVQTVILDTVGNWYGLRLAADGRGPGLDVPVFGGLRGDLPMLSTGGEIVADVAVESGRSLVLDLSQFSLAERRRFATDFGERLWRQKKAETHSRPLMLVIEESQLIVPQKVDAASARMVGIYEEIIRLGRNYGIGAMMISQRPQSVNKEVLNQTECLLVFQTNGSHERKALREWMAHQGMDGEVVNELPGLPAGTAYVWSPQWLGLLRKVRVAAKTTFDASATPTVGSAVERRAPAPLDLGEIRARMAAATGEASATDPAALRRQVAELRQQLARASATPAPTPTPAPKVAARLDRQARKRMKEEIARERVRLGELTHQLGAIHETMLGAIERYAATLDFVLEPLPGEDDPAPSPVAEAAAIAAAPVPEATTGTETAGRVGAGGRLRILTALAQRPKGLTARALGVRAGLSSRSGTFGTYLAALKASGWIAGGREHLEITPAGRMALGKYEPLPVGQRLLAYWLNQLGEDHGAARMLRALADAHPAMLTKTELGQRAALSSASGTFGTYLGRLRQLELVTGRTELGVSPELLDS